MSYIRFIVSFIPYSSPPPFFWVGGYDAQEKLRKYTFFNTNLIHLFFIGGGGGGVMTKQRKIWGKVHMP